MTCNSMDLCLQPPTAPSGKTDAEAKPLGAVLMAVALIAPVALSHESGKLRRSASPHRVNTWSAGGESWAWAPQMVPSGASPCSVGIQCAKPQFPLNAPSPGRKMQKKPGFFYHLNSSVSCLAGRRLGSNYASSMCLSLGLSHWAGAAGR